MSNSSYLENLFTQIKERSKNLDPSKSYTAYLASLTSEAVSKKLMEEAFELSIANIEMQYGKKREELIGEAADVIYHLMALIAIKDIDLSEVIDELKKRGGVKKIDEINFKKS